MIEEASITIAQDGGVLVTLPRTGMNPAAETRVSVRGGRLRIGQGSQWFVSAELDDPTLADAFIGNPDVTVVEVDDAGFEIHNKVLEATP